MEQYDGCIVVSGTLVDGTKLKLTIMYLLERVGSGFNRVPDAPNIWIIYLYERWNMATFQASHLVNIPIPWSIWVLNCNPYFGKRSNLTNIFVNSFIETRVYSLCHTLWCCWWWNSGMTVNNWWLTLSSHLKIDALKTIFSLWGSSYFWGANCWFQRVYYTWDNF